MAQAFSGFSWSGHEVSYFSLVLEATFKPTRPWILAAQNLGNGTAQLLGSLAGGAFLALTSRDFRLMFLVSVGLRMAIALALPVLAPPSPRGRGSGAARCSSG